MIDAIEQIMRKLPPVKDKNAGVACALGFFFGGIGLAIYFRNIIDLVFPLAIGIFLTIFLGTDMGWFAGALLAATYGYFRVNLSAPVTA